MISGPLLRPISTTRLDPQLAAAPFQLYNLHRLAGDAPQAARYLADFKRIQGVPKAWVTPEDIDWCPYAEIYDPPEPIFADTRLEGAVDAATAGLTLIDSAGDGQTDLLVWSTTC